MKFVLLDRISEFEPGRRVVAHKALSLAEEYLADHFPRFPVLPGVLMLEAMVQTSAWLVRAALDFVPSLVLLKEARNVTYKSFVAPGQVLRIESVCKELSDEHSAFTANGTVGECTIVKAQFTLRHLCLADADPARADLDEQMRAHLRARFELLTMGCPTAAASGCS